MVDRFQARSFSAFMTGLESFAEENGFKMAKSCHYFKKPEELGFEQDAKIASRSTFSCFRRKTCPFNNTFTYIRLEKCYQVTKCSLSHNHEMKKVVDIVNFAHELTAEETRRMQELGPTLSQVPEVRLILKSSFPKRNFSSELIYRQLKIGRERFLGNDAGSMVKLEEFGIIVLNPKYKPYMPWLWK